MADESKTTLPGWPPVIQSTPGSDTDNAYNRGYADGIRDAAKPVGCVCPAGAEVTCKATFCHRRGFYYYGASAI